MHPALHLIPAGLLLTAAFVAGECMVEDRRNGLGINTRDAVFWFAALAAAGIALWPTFIWLFEGIG